MRFLTIVRAAENQGPPPPALMEAIGKLGEEAFRNRTMVMMGGLYPSVAGATVRLADGKMTVTDGPFAEAKEVIGGFAMFEFETKEQALRAATHFMELHRMHWPGWQGETEVRQVYPQ
jgi:hypothetical protein